MLLNEFWNASARLLQEQHVSENRCSDSLEELQGVEAVPAESKADSWKNFGNEQLFFGR